MEKYKPFSGIIFLGILLITGIPNFRLLAQSDITIKFDEELSKQFDYIKFPEKCKDSLSLILEIDSLTRDFHDAGYLSANTRGINRDENSYKVDFDPGIKFSHIFVL